MRILFIADVCASVVTGGGPRALRAQVDGLSRRGHEVVILTKSLPGKSETPEVTLPCGAREIQVPWGGGRGARDVLTLRADARQRLGLLLDTWKPERIVVQQPLLAGGVMSHPGLAGIPWLYVCYSFAFEEYATRDDGIALKRTVGSWWLRREEARFYKEAEKVVVLSDFTTRRLAEVFGRGNGVVKISGGVAGERFRAMEDQRPQLRARWGMKSPTFLTVRNLVARTGVDLLVDAFALLHGRHPGIQLLIAGTGALEGQIRAQIAAKGLEDSVRMLGFVEEDDLPGLYAAADCFVLPTRFMEGFGLVTVEALACGTPVVATPVGANHEVAGGWRNDAVVDSLEPTSLASGMERVLRVLERDETGVRASAASYGAKFTWRRHVDKLEETLMALQGVQ
ncbi:MAG: hypothetical protein COX57_08150 [Alphaproteobacteria bacterium CG_4_10_14_0_2_um_filter_63_37]|nr:MAG: hypothetical protein AUJ55_07785 [Proteobacteria bacterium CG1_02_64_396]PJA24430.1 MAG: hypothetical protein COX57_08150 [Alphaproteobacteria bacterium CG_4_10_14_0_2_um_filter_63_37]